MSENLHDRGLDGRGHIELFFHGLETLDKAHPESEERFDYPSFMARELFRGLQAKGELDFD